MIDVAQCPPCCSVADSRAGCPYVFAAAEVSQERENGVAEREKKGGVKGDLKRMPMDGGFSAKGKAGAAQTARFTNYLHR